MTTLTAHTTIRRSRMGVMPFPRGDWSATVSDYFWNDDKRDLVNYNGYWYAVKKFDPFNAVPKGSTPSSTSAYWELSTQFSMLVAGMILSEHIAAGAITADKIAADAIKVTGEIIANAILANSLNVNNNFKVSKLGIVELVDAIVAGRVRSSNNGTRAEFNPSDGCIDLYYNNNIQGKVGWSSEGMVVWLYDSTSKYVTKILPGQVMFSKAASGSGSYATSLTIDVASLNLGAQTQATLYADSNGFVKIKSSTGGGGTVYYKVELVASPSAGGTVSGGGTKVAGDSGTITATPASGYRFNNWSDGNTSASRTITWDGNKTLTANFVVATVNYTITLIASPSAGGTVSGGGTYLSGSSREIRATPASGYTFSRWNDGNTNSVRSIVCDADKTLTAYFDVYAPSGTELLPSAGLANASGIVSINTGQTESSKLIVITKQFFWYPIKGADATMKGVAIDKGKFVGVIKQGVNYKFTCQARTPETGKAFVVMMGSYNEPLFDLSIDTLADTYLGIEMTNEFQTLEMSFVAVRNATVNDAVIFLSDDITGTTVIKSMSLKEA